MDTPVLFLIFNRIDTAKKVFETVTMAKPAKLYIACDGARQHVQGEAEVVNDLRAYVLANVTWPCEVKTLFREHNMGCRWAVSSAIDWFFENEEQGIILEDDCLPDPSFFGYCEKMLYKYRNDERVMHIAGCNFQNDISRSDGSYYFSKICHIWGWATWRRAWALYDVEMKTYPQFKEYNHIEYIFQDKKYTDYMYRCFDATFDGRINTWDYQWVFTIWSQGGLCVAPQKNLISNIGFGEHATLTKNSENYFANRPLFAIEEELVEPTFMVQNKIADIYTMDLILMRPPLSVRAVNKFKKGVIKIKKIFKSGVKTEL